MSPYTSEALAGAGRPISHRDVFAIALPIIVSNVTTPLIGVADTAVIGQSGNPALIGGVALGAIIFSMLFWSFGFLRMGTSGFTAQADGRGDPQEVAASLERALVLAIAIGVLLVLVQAPVGSLSMWLIEGSPEAEAAARLYYDVRIWSAPLALANYAVLGWVIGLGRTGTAFLLQVVLNLTNIGLDLLFVLGFDWGVAGVAWATVAAEGMALVLGLVLCARELARRGGRAPLAVVLGRSELHRAFAVNGDIMIRNLALLAAFVWFTSAGASAGDVILAANAILITLFDVVAYMLDGFAQAAEVLVGRAVGARQRERFHEAVRLTTLHTMGLAVVLSLAAYALGHLFISLVTTSAEVREAARTYLVWAALSPFAGAMAFLYDGIFTGATRGRDMRNMTILSLVAFLAASWALTPAFANHGLWAALNVFFVARGVLFAACMPRLSREVFG